MFLYVRPFDGVLRVVLDFVLNSHKRIFVAANSSHKCYVLTGPCSVVVPIYRGVVTGNDHRGNLRTTLHSAQFGENIAFSMVAKSPDNQAIITGYIGATTVLFAPGRHPNTLEANTNSAYPFHVGGLTDIQRAGSGSLRRGR